MTPRGRSLLLALALGVASAFGGERGGALHDPLGHLAPAPDLPVAVVEVEGSPERAARAALEAGARSARMALPEGHRLLGGAPPEDLALREDAGGRVRWAGELRLPLPEALDGLLVLHEDQLAPGGPGGLLAGRDVVLVHEDPALGLSVAAPGRVTPARRAEVLAVGLGAAAGVGALRTLPAPLAAALVGGLALLASEAARRRTPTAAMGQALLGAVALLLVAVGARALSLDLPVVGLVTALLAPAMVRAARASQQALDALDRISLRLGGAGPRQDSRPPLVQLVDTVAVYAPRHTVGAWAVRRDGTLEQVAIVESPHSLRPPAQAPARTFAAPGQLIVPVVDRGEVIGALGLAGPAAGSPETRPWLEALAQLRPGVGLRYTHDPLDPFDTRMALAYRGVSNAVGRARAREVLEREEVGVMGVFDLAGGLVVGSGPLRALLQRASGLPLLAALESLAALPPEVLRQIVRDRASSLSPQALKGADPTTEVLLTPLSEHGAPVALLLQVVQVRKAAREQAPVKVAVVPTKAEVRLRTAP